MRKHLNGCWPFGRVERKERCEKRGAGICEEGEFSTDDGANGLGGAGKTEGFCVGKAAERGPRFLRGNTTKFEDLIEAILAYILVKIGRHANEAYFKELIDFILPL